MPRNTSVTLGEHFDRFVVEKIKEGRHGIFHTITESGIDIIGILDQRMDIMSYFE